MASVRRRRSCSCFSLGERLRPLLPGPLHHCAMIRAQHRDSTILAAPRRPSIAIPCIWDARPRGDQLSARARGVICARSAATRGCASALCIALQSRERCDHSCGDNVATPNAAECASRNCLLLFSRGRPRIDARALRPAIGPAASPSRQSPLRQAPAWPRFRAGKSSPSRSLSALRGRSSLRPNRRQCRRQLSFQRVAWHRIQPGSQLAARTEARCRFGRPESPAHSRSGPR